MSIVSDTNTGLICAIVTNKDGGYEIERLIATEILRSFIEAYSDHFEGNRGGMIKKSTFNSFSNRIPDAVSNVVGKLLERTMTFPGVDKHRMLKSLYIIRTNGLVVYEKYWNRGKKLKEKISPQALPFLFQMSQDQIGYPVSFIETTSSAMSIVSDTNTGLICAIVTNKDGGYEIERLIATEILRSFIEAYSDHFEGNRGGMIKKSTFNSFSNRIPDAVSNVVGKLLERTMTFPGVEGSLYYNDDIEMRQEIDNISVVASLKTFIRHSAESMINLGGDSPSYMQLDCVNRIIFIFRIEEAFWINICYKEEKPASYFDKIINVSNLLHKMNRIISHYQ
eukprot:TRINITY_DN540_c0_g1_i1.p1 TRINITY_DN540_c0_g1~~TRINITY_DN540_c0_g1_i1.p1  ORF type:complete len:337 (+),score=52.90 TRINITY_DN540_c0_g1_i1:365-1375(+)